MDLSLNTRIKTEPNAEDTLYREPTSICRRNNVTTDEVHDDGYKNGVLRSLFTSPESSLTTPAANLLTCLANEYQLSQNPLSDSRSLLLTSENARGCVYTFNEECPRGQTTQSSNYSSSSMTISTTRIKMEKTETPSEADRIKEQDRTGRYLGQNGDNKLHDSVIKSMLAAPPIHSPVQNKISYHKSEEFEHQSIDSNSEKHGAYSTHRDGPFKTNDPTPSHASDDALDSPETFPLLPPKAANPQMTREDFNAFCQAILLNGGPAKINNDDSSSGNTDNSNTVDIFNKISRGQQKGKRKFQCDICHKSYGHNSSLKVHYRVHTGERPFKCHVCDRDFSHSNSLQIHVRTHTEKPQFKCDHCPMEFSRSNSLSRHMLTHTREKPFVCGVCGKSFSQACNLKTHMRSHTGDKPFKCDFCGKAFRVAEKLKIHTRIHTGDRPYQCTVCQKTFATSGVLKSHSSIHTGIKPYKCKVCGKGFTVSNDLKKHSRVHTGEKPYTCNMCGKAFGQSSTLQKHLHTHSGNRPHKCEICGKGFVESTHVIRHMRTHTGDKPFTCNICHKSFSGDLAKHMRTHIEGKPYKCDICLKGFRNPSYMKQHKMKHTASRPYPCSYCTMRFMQPSDLNAHVRTHTDSKPFKGEIGGKTFAQSDHLERHIISDSEGNNQTPAKRNEMKEEDFSDESETILEENDTNT
ncbi:zinc finger protein ZFP2-like [Ylistrum balloti]|uniref:zinc finger protein ZFP2-like n=1 Tax=Ylistrum balloti TaxID=509963 RepID=UPI002905B05C|nr:zinc finger protein ZFP2-like [Ylistrum balloti]